MYLDPVLIERANNMGWLALTPPDSPWRIGVLGADATDAREHFAEALGRWDAIPRAKPVA